MAADRDPWGGVGGAWVRLGEVQSGVVKSYGLCRTTIYKWLKAARRGGEAALTARKHPGREPALRAKATLAPPAAVAPSLGPVTVT